MQMRYYQEEILNKVLSSRDNDIVQLETGAGKTRIELELCKNEECTVITHRRELQRQLKKNIPNTRVLMAQSCAKNIERYCGDDNTLIIDEGHHYQDNNIWGKIARKHPRVVLFTATPWRLDGKPFSKRHGSIFDKIVQSEKLGEYPTRRLIDDGFLSDFDFFRPERVVYSHGNRQEVAEDPVVFCKKNDCGKTLVFCNTFDTAKKINTDFIANGFSSSVISSHFSDLKNKKIMKDYRCSVFDILINVNMVSEGIDIPDLKTVILTSKTSSLTRYRQWAGRVLRPHKNKDRAIIADMTGNSFEFGFPDSCVKWDIDRFPSNIKDAGKIECSSCGNWFDVNFKRCPSCGCSSFLFKGLSFGMQTCFENCSNIELAKKAVLNFREELLCKKIVEPSIYTGSVLLDDYMKKIMEQIAFVLSDCSANDVNCFMRAGTDFFMENFKASEIEDNVKLKKVFKKWLKHS